MAELTVAETAQRLGLTELRAIRLLEQEHLQGRQADRTWLVDVDSLERYIQFRAEAAAAPRAGDLRQIREAYQLAERQLHSAKAAFTMASHQDSRAVNEAEAATLAVRLQRLRERRDEAWDGYVAAATAVLDD